MHHGMTVSPQILQILTEKALHVQGIILVDLKATGFFRLVELLLVHVKVLELLRLGII